MSLCKFHLNSYDIQLSKKVWKTIFILKPNSVFLCAVILHGFEKRPTAITPHKNTLTKYCSNSLGGSANQNAKLHYLAM